MLCASPAPACAAQDGHPTLAQHPSSLGERRGAMEVNRDGFSHAIAMGGRHGALKIMNAYDRSFQDDSRMVWAMVTPSVLICNAKNCLDHSLNSVIVFTMINNGCL